MSKTCGACNRPLKDPDSIARGFGPVCWRGHAGDTHITPRPRRPARRRRLPEDRPLLNFPDLTNDHKGQGVIKIYGASDDLIEVDGDIRAEFPVTDTGDDGVLLAASNGVVLRIRYRTCWRLELVAGAGLVEIVPCPEDDETNYSDVATIPDDVAWVVCRDTFVTA